MQNKITPTGTSKAGVQYVLTVRAQGGAEAIFRNVIDFTDFANKLIFKTVNVVTKETQLYVLKNYFYYTKIEQK